MMGADRFIARRIKFQGRLASTAIAVSFLVIIIAIAVSAGFRREIQSGVAALTGDIILATAPSAGIGEDGCMKVSESYMDRMAGMDGVTGLTPVIYRAGIVKAGSDIQGVMFKGIPSSDSTLCVRIPSRLASILNLGKGDAMVTYFIGEKVKVRKFTVSDIYDSILDSDDKLVVYAPIEDIRRLNEWEEDEVSSIEVTVAPGKRTRGGLRAMAMQMTAYSMDCATEDDDVPVATSSGDKYSQLFDWLDLIDFNVVAVLLLMTIVAGFDMISGLLILLFRHISTIGTLKALGMTDKGIASVFLRVSARTVLKGIVAGNAAALLLCLVQGMTHLIKLNPENYFVSFVPVSVNPAVIVLADVVSFAAIMLLLLIPCIFISKIDPSETVKAE